MTPVEKLEAAIARLETLKADSVTGPWRRYGLAGITAAEYDVSFEGRVWQDDPDDATVVMGIARAEDADLIVTLHRTIDAQLSILREDLETSRKNRWIPDRWALALADAILGGA